jgi:alanyl-tRNA synthetase
VRGGIDWLRQKRGSAAVLLATRGEGKVTLIAGVTDDLVDRGGHAGNWLREVASLVGGKGGGRPQMAQGGGGEPDNLPDALVQARSIFVGMLKS